jgi:predicted ATPase
VLGVKESAGGDATDALARFVRDRHLLLILDNCEHLLHASAELAKQLLQAGPRVKVLATSRDYLQTAGEAAYHVPPLSAPDPRQPKAPEALAQHAAVQLFVDRAHAAQPAFRIDARNAAAVAQICHRLDGIPLALELAAARTRALSAEAIAARLNDRFKLLVTGDRTVLPRQRTLRALIDWSYDLLPAPERALFERLAVFAGGFTLDAAEAVAAFGEVAQTDVLDLLTHLVEKSLVQMEVGGERYRMLETVREYAREKLDATDDAAPARDRHLFFFVDFAERARPGLRGHDQGAWLRRVDLDLENILSAHAFSQATQERGTLQWRLVEALRVYWINRGLLSLGLRLNVNLLERDDPPLSDADRCRTLFGAGQMSFLMGSHRQARAYLAECQRVALAVGDASVAAGVLQPLGMACLAEGHYGAARVHLEHALALARERGDKREIVGALNAVAMLYRLQQRLDQAEPLYAEALDLARAMSHREYTATILLNLAMVAIGRGLLDEASEMLREVVTIAVETDAKPLVQSTLEVCAGLAAARADWAHAARFFGIAEAHHEETGLSRDPADERFLEPLIALARSALGGQQFDADMASGRAVTTRGALSEAGRWVAAPPPTA